MAAASPVEEPTKAILANFKAMGFSSGAILQRERVEMQFKVNGGNADDFIPALKQVQIAGGLVFRRRLQLN